MATKNCVQRHPNNTRACRYSPKGSNWEQNGGDALVSSSKEGLVLLLFEVVLVPLHSRPSVIRAISRLPLCKGKSLRRDEGRRPSNEDNSEQTDELITTED